MREQASFPFKKSRSAEGDIYSKQYDIYNRCFKVKASWSTRGFYLQENQIKIKITPAAVRFLKILAFLKTSEPIAMYNIGTRDL